MDDMPSRGWCLFDCKRPNQSAYTLFFQMPMQSYMQPVWQLSSPWVCMCYFRWGWLEAGIVLRIYAFVPVGMISRRGLCRMGHVNANDLILQYKLAKRFISLASVPCEMNPSDNCTQSLDGKLTNVLMSSVAMIRSRYIVFLQALMIAKSCFRCSAMPSLKAWKHYSMCDQTKSHQGEILLTPL